MSTRERLRRAKTPAQRDEFRSALTRLRLTAIGRQSLVLLGDPTVTVPVGPP